MQTARMAGNNADGASFDQLSAALRISLTRCPAWASGDGRRVTSAMLGRMMGRGPKGNGGAEGTPAVAATVADPVAFWHDQHDHSVPRSMDPPACDSRSAPRTPDSPPPV